DGILLVEPQGKRKFRVSGDFCVSEDTALSAAVIALDAGDDWRGAGRVTVVDGAGKETVEASPPGNGGVHTLANIKALRIRNAAGDEITATFDAPCDLRCDGQIRYPLAGEKAKADEPRAWSFTLEFPFDVEVRASKTSTTSETERYFAWTPGSDTGPSVIGAAHLLDAPAGRHGRVKSVGDKLVYNGKPVKLWGLNNCYGSCLPPRELAGRRAAFYAKNGVNAVRMHKYAEGGALSADSAKLFNEANMANMDHYIKCLADKGIYTKLSPVFGSIPVGPADRANVPFMDEMGRPGGNGWQTANQASFWISKDVQDILIGQTVNLLNRVNTATGARYADDPALFMVEIINENCAFFYSTWGGANGVPTLKRMAGEQFRDWLHKKYGTEEKLLAAWKNYNGVPDQGTAGESWDGLIYPAVNPWYVDSLGANDARWPRIVDATLFWFDTQNAVYDRFAAALRATGYDGEIIGSNWLAGSGIAHYLNLISDARVGVVDRHNYHGAYWSMFHKPGCGILSVGLNTQIEDRPYMVSEWIHEAKAFMADPKIPKPFDIASEGPVLVAAYGMGLNGWDASFIFQNGDNGVFSQKINDTWDPFLPNIMGLFPAISRQVLRGDIKESELVFARNVDLASLSQGKVGFNDTLESGGYDIREFTSDILPEQLLAVGRNVVRVNDKPVATEAVDPARFMKDGRLVSATGELSWRAGYHNRDGDITINTPFTQALAGFTQGRRAALADVDIQTDVPYAVIYVTSLDDAKPIAQAKNLLITALARIRNTGQNISGNSTTDWGTGPILMEPVAAEINVKRAGAFTVHILDQDGRRSGEKLPVQGRVITFDTAKDKTIYYEVEFN
ncbi:MAG: beta-galactosidase, partial [Kiritimatiellaeota bacterium]|nr:beta-galactosidase [Kiritimatiellota bacterium]